MSAHDKLKAKGITPTIDAERAYRLGYAQAERELRQDRDELRQKVARLQQMLAEIGLMARRAR